MVPADVGDREKTAVLCGPTSVGKSALGVPLAKALNAEIVCADSRTIYRGMDIGTAKPTAAQRQQVPHHLLDVAWPETRVTVADVQRLGREAMDAIRRRGRLPLVVGGTGLYIRALVDDLVLPVVPPDPLLRARLERAEGEHGPRHLHGRLAALDPVAASRIHPHNVRRLVRALEVVLVTGRPISEQQHATRSASPVVMVGLTMDRASLYRRIDDRVDAQLAGGLEDEVRTLLAHGVPPDAPAMQALGYKEIAGWLRGEYDAAEAVRRFKRNTRRYAKRQLTWFRGDPRVAWIDVTGMEIEVLVTRVRDMMDTEFRTQGRR